MQVTQVAQLHVTGIVVQHIVTTTNNNTASQIYLGAKRKENMNKNTKLMCKNCGHKETLENVTESMNTKILIAQVPRVREKMGWIYIRFYV